MAAGQAATLFNSNGITVQDIIERIIDDGDLSLEVKEWIQQNRGNLDKPVCDTTGRTLLHFAAATGNFKFTSVILQKSVDPCHLLEVRDGEEKTPLQVAVHQNRSMLIEGILKNDRINVSRCVMQTAERYGTLLHQACRLGYSAVVKALLSHENEELMIRQITAKIRNSKYTPLHQASLKGHTTIVKLLMEIGEQKLNLPPKDLAGVKNKSGNSPVHTAIIYGDIETVKVMIKKYPDCINLKSEALGTPFYAACNFGRVDIAEYLADCGATVTEPHYDKLYSFKDTNYMTPMMIACLKGHTSIVKFLLDMVKVKPIHLIMAIRGRSEETASLLLLHHGKRGRQFEDLLQTCDYHGRTPFQKLIKNMPNVAEAVLDKCIIVDAANKESKFDYQFIEGYEHEDTKWTTDKLTYKKDAIPLSTMVKFKRANLLTHPVVTSYIHQKLKNVGLFYFLLWLLFVIYLACITTLALSLSTAKNNATLPNLQTTRACINAEVGAKHILFAVFCLLYALFGLSIKTMILLTRSWYTCKQPELKKEFNVFMKSFFFIQQVIHFVDVLQITFFVATIVYSIAIFTVTNRCIPQTMSQLGAIVIFLSWLKLLIISAPFRLIGVYALMLLRIVKSFFKVLLVFVLLLITFVLSLHVSIPNTVESKSDNTIAGGIVDLLSRFTSLSFEGFLSPPITFLLLLVFVVLMVILFSNLLIGLAVGDIQNIYANAIVEMIILQVQFILDIDTSWRVICKTLCKKKLKVIDTFSCPKGSVWDQFTSCLVVLLFGGEGFNSRKSYKNVCYRYYEFADSMKYVYEYVPKTATQSDINELRDFIERFFSHKASEQRDSESVSR